MQAMGTYNVFLFEPKGNAKVSIEMMYDDDEPIHYSIIAIDYEEAIGKLLALKLPFIEEENDVKMVGVEEEYIYGSETDEV